MKGIVDNGGRSLLTVQVGSRVGSDSSEVIANDGEYPLLGVGLLLGLELRVDYRNLTLMLQRVAKETT